MSSSKIEEGSVVAFFTGEQKVRYGVVLDFIDNKRDPFNPFLILRTYDGLEKIFYKRIKEVIPTRHRAQPGNLLHYYEVHVTTVTPKTNDLSDGEKVTYYGQLTSLKSLTKTIKNRTKRRRKSRWVPWEYANEYPQSDYEYEQRRYFEEKWFEGNYSKIPKVLMDHGDWEIWWRAFDKHLNSLTKDEQEKVKNSYRPKVNRLIAERNALAL